MVQAPTSSDQYLSHFQALTEGLGATEPQWLRQIRLHAMERFSDLGLPTARRGNEKWKYTSVAPIARGTFRPVSEPSPNGARAGDLQRLAPWHRGWNTLVFLDGHYSEALSTAPVHLDGIMVSDLAEAIASSPELIEGHLARYASVEDDGFTALNTALVRDGAFVYIPEGESLKRPLHIVFASSGQEEATVSHPRVLVVAGAGSRASVIESYVGPSQSRYFTNAVSEMVLGQGARIDHYRLLLESENAFHVGVARVHQEEGSTFSSRAFAKGPALGRYDLYITLDGPQSACYLNGLYVTSGTQHLDNFINIDHTKPNTTSRLYYKGILDGKSRAVFGGTVWVRKDAQKTDALQSDKNLVLSPDAEVDSKPALFIYADDVKCGHGATAGNIDRDTVFYMRSRGLDLETASHLLISGFASEVIETVQIEELKAFLERAFLESLPSYRFEF